MVGGSANAIYSRASHLQDMLKFLLNNRVTYERKWTESLSDDTRKNIDEIWTSLGNTVRRSKNLADEVKAFLERNEHPSPQDCQQRRDDLNENAVDISNLMGALNMYAINEYFVNCFWLMSV